MPVVENVLEAEGAADGNLPVLGETLEVAGRVGRPATAADDRERALGLDQQLAKLLQDVRIRIPPHRHDARQDRRGRGRGQHVLRQRQHHRPGTSLHRRAEGACHIFGQAVGRLHLAHPLRQAEGARAEHLAVVDLLESLAIALVGGHLAHQQDHRRRVLEGDMHADAGVGRARPARDEADARAAGQLAVGLGHEGGAAFVATGDEADAVAMLVEAVQRRQEALAGHPEHRVDALGDQGLHEGVAGETGGERGRGSGHGDIGRGDVNRDGSRAREGPRARALPPKKVPH